MGFDAIDWSAPHPVLAVRLTCGEAECLLKWSEEATARRIRFPRGAVEDAIVEAADEPTPERLTVFARGVVVVVEMARAALATDDGLNDLWKRGDENGGDGGVLDPGARVLDPGSTVLLVALPSSEAWLAERTRTALADQLAPTGFSPLFISDAYFCTHLLLMGRDGAERPTLCRSTPLLAVGVGLRGSTVSTITLVDDDGEPHVQLATDCCDFGVNDMVGLFQRELAEDADLPLTVEDADQFARLRTLMEMTLGPGASDFYRVMPLDDEEDGADSPGTADQVLGERVREGIAASDLLVCVRERAKSLADDAATARPVLCLYGNGAVYGAVAELLADACPEADLVFDEPVAAPSVPAPDVVPTFTWSALPEASPMSSIYRDAVAARAVATAAEIMSARDPQTDEPAVHRVVVEHLQGTEQRLSHVLEELYCSIAFDSIEYHQTGESNSFYGAICKEFPAYRTWASIARYDEYVENVCDIDTDTFSARAEAPLLSSRIHHLFEMSLVEHSIELLQEAVDEKSLLSMMSERVGMWFGGMDDVTDAICDGMEQPKRSREFALQAIAPWAHTHTYPSDYWEASEYVLELNGYRHHDDVMHSATNELVEGLKQKQLRKSKLLFNNFLSQQDFERWRLFSDCGERVRETAELVAARVAKNMVATCNLALNLLAVTLFDQIATRMASVMSHDGVLHGAFQQDCVPCLQSIADFYRGHVEYDRLPPEERKERWAHERQDDDYPSWLKPLGV